MKGFTESLIVFGVMTGILLPTRIFFMSYVSESWLGSFGLISAISILLLLLTKKNKLGKFGKIFERQMKKIQYGKRGVLVYGESIFSIVLIGSLIFAIDVGSTTNDNIQDQIKTAQKDLRDLNFNISTNVNEGLFDSAQGFFKLPKAAQAVFPPMASILAIENNATDGWLLHILTIGLMESFEIVGIMIFYRIAFRNIKYPENKINPLYVTVKKMTLQ